MKVSIITSTFNSCNYIEQTIKSVINQDYTNLEYIIVDGSSQDNTMEIVEKYSRYCSIIISEQDNGPYDAFNKGITQSSGDLIGFLHSGDTFNTNATISNMVNELIIQKKDAIYGDLNYISNDTTKRITRKWVSGKYHRSKFLFGWMPPHPSLLIKKNIYNSFGGYDESFGTAADYELIIRFFYKYHISCAYIPDVAVNMIEGGVSNSSIKNRILAHINDWKAWRNNNISKFPIWVLLKPIRKIIQYLK